MIYLEALTVKSNSALPRALNFGPLKAETLTVGEIASEIQTLFGIGQNWSVDNADSPPEKALLSLNAQLASQNLNWQPCWGTTQTLRQTASWYNALKEGQDMYAYSRAQIEDYEAIHG